MQLIVLIFMLYIFLKTPKCLYRFSEKLNNYVTKNYHSDNIDNDDKN